MAASTITVNVATIDFTWKSGKMYNVIGTLVVGASPLTYTTGGLAVSFNAELIKSQSAPLMCIVNGQANQAAQTQYDYTFTPGSNNTNGILKIFTGGVELTGGAAIPSGVSADTIQFYAIFLGMN